MTERTELYNSTYGHFTDPVFDAIRRETFGVDIGQNSWTTVDEYDCFLAWLELAPGQVALEVACGSGGPALYVAQKTGCRVVGIDANEAGIATATALAARAATPAGSGLEFRVADANARLPFDDDTFDALICIDAMNHFPNRLAVLREWRRVLKPGRRAVFTDPVVITGPVTSDELALRSSIGQFLFVPMEANQLLIDLAGLALVRDEDLTRNASQVSGQWHDSRAAHRDELVNIEGEERFEGLQRFFACVHSLARRQQLSRMVYLAEKPKAG